MGPRPGRPTRQFVKRYIIDIRLEKILLQFDGPAHSPPLQRGRVSFGEYIGETTRKVLPAEQLGGARVLCSQLQRVPRRGEDADAHANAPEAQCRAGAHTVKYGHHMKKSIIIRQTSHHTRHKNVISRAVMITKGRDITATGLKITALHDVNGSCVSR